MPDPMRETREKGAFKRPSNLVRDLDRASKASKATLNQLRPRLSRFPGRSDGDDKSSKLLFAAGEEIDPRVFTDHL